MDLIKIERVNDCDVVDSRLIAIELEIQHKNFLATINKYKAEIEQDFGALAFQTEGLQGTRNYAEYYFLNEEQATYVMTLSKNTDKVRQCKRKLVKSFSIAKQVIAKQQENIQELTLRLALANAEKDRFVAEKNLLDTRHFITTALPEPIQQKVLGYSEVRVVEYRDRVIKDSEIIRDGSTYNKTQLCRRYGFLNKKGNPDYRKLNLAMAHLPIPEDAWERKVALQDNIEFKAEYIHELDDMLLRSERQLYLAE